MADATTSVGSSAVPQGTGDRGTGLAGALLGAIALLAWATLILPAIGWRMPLPPMRGPDPTVAGGSRVAAAIVAAFSWRSGSAARCAATMTP